VIEGFETNANSTGHVDLTSGILHSDCWQSCSHINKKAGGPCRPSRGAGIQPLPPGCSRYC